MYLERRHNEIVITEKTGCLWIFGIFFILCGAPFVYGSLGGFSNWEDIPSWQLFLAFVMGSIGIATGCRIILCAPFTKIYVNDETQTIIHRTHGLIDKNEKLYRFDEVKQFLVIEKYGSEGVVWDSAIELLTGEIIVLSVMSGEIEKAEREIVFETNQFMQKQMPSYKTALEIDDL